MPDNRFTVDETGDKPAVVDADNGKRYPFADLDTAARTAERANERAEIMNLYTAIQEVKSPPPLI